MKYRLSISELPRPKDFFYGRQPPGFAGNGGASLRKLEVVSCVFPPETASLTSYPGDQDRKGDG
jgi:hypothetical protein